MTDRAPTRLERWLGTPQQTMPEGAGTDPVPDPEFNASAEQALPVGVGLGTFPHDPNDGRTYESGDADPVKAETVKAEPWTELRPDDWNTTGVVDLPAETSRKALSRNVGRYSLVITNEGTSELRLGRTEAQAKYGRPLPVGGVYEASHKAPVWIYSVLTAGAYCADEELMNGTSWD